MREIFAYPRQDLVAGVVVFLVALPLCLGIAVACGVPPLSGLVAGVIGGLVVPFVSRSPLSVTGPAAGLTSIVLLEVGNIGISAFLTAVALAGVLQIVGGLVRAGRLSSLVPSAVIKGMLAAIGLTILKSQLPVAVGVSTGLANLVGQLHVGALLIAVVSLGILTGWSYTPAKRLTFVPPALVVVAVGTAMGQLFRSIPSLALTPAQFVSVPTEGLGALVAALPRPDLHAALATETWVVAATLAVVASLETLLSLQAVDRLDPLHRRSPPDRELLAQGLANLVSGLVGGLPVTAVIVRSGANVAAGGRQRLSAIVHALLLLIAVVALGPWLNLIPLPALAAVLIRVGLGLCRPGLFREQWALGRDQFAPFLITIVAILGEDLLVGVLIGMLVGVAFVLHQNSSNAVTVRREGEVWWVTFRRDGTFVAKPTVLAALEPLPDHAKVVIDATNEYLDQDMKELLASYISDASRRGIVVSKVGFDLDGVDIGGHG